MALMPGLPICPADFMQLHPSTPAHDMIAFVASGMAKRKLGGD
jgi:hypothetical protein